VPGSQLHIQAPTLIPKSYAKFWQLGSWPVVAVSGRTNVVLLLLLLLRPLALLVTPGHSLSLLLAGPQLRQGLLQACRQCMVHQVMSVLWHCPT